MNNEYGETNENRIVVREPLIKMPVLSGRATDFRSKSDNIKIVIRGICCVGRGKCPVTIFCGHGDGPLGPLRGCDFTDPTEQASVVIS
jgi:hypothetical protein